MKDKVLKSALPCSFFAAYLICLQSASAQNSWNQVPAGSAPPNYATPNSVGGETVGGYANYTLPPYVPPYRNTAPPPQAGYNPYGAAPPVNFGAPSYSQPSYGAPPSYPQPYGAPSSAQSNSGYAAPGLNIPLSLTTAISTQVAKDGDFVQATTSQNVPLQGYAYIPAGTVVTGAISDTEAGRRLSRSGALSITFNQLRLPSGATVPISGHLVGSIGKYKDVGKDNQDLYRGEGWGTKIGQLALRGGMGAGLGAGLGTAVGAIGGGGHGAGMGAWSGAAIGGGIGGLDMLLRKGKDVLIPSGTAMQLVLDAPATIPGPGSAPPEYAQPVNEGQPPQYAQPQYGAPPQPQYNQQSYPPPQENYAQPN